MSHSTKEEQQAWVAKRPGYKGKKSKLARARLKLKVFELLGLKCQLCDEKDLNILQIDHINGGGTRERLETRCEYWYYFRQIWEKLLAGSKEYRLLCANCNWKERRRRIGQLDLNELYRKDKEETRE